MLYKTLYLDDLKNELHGEYTPIAIEAIFQYFEYTDEPIEFDRIAIITEFFEYEPESLFLEYSYLIGYDCSKTPTPPECIGEPTPESLEKLFNALQDRTYIEKLDNLNYLLIAF